MAVRERHDRRDDPVRQGWPSVGEGLKSLPTTVVHACVSLFLLVGLSLWLVQAREGPPPRFAPPRVVTLVAAVAAPGPLTMAPHPTPLTSSPYRTESPSASSSHIPIPPATATVVQPVELSPAMATTQSVHPLAPLLLKLQQLQADEVEAEVRLQLADDSVEEAVWSKRLAVYKPAIAKIKQLLSSAPNVSTSASASSLPLSSVPAACGSPVPTQDKHSKKQSLDVPSVPRSQPDQPHAAPPPVATPPKSCPTVVLPTPTSSATASSRPLSSVPAACGSPVSTQDKHSKKQSLDVPSVPRSQPDQPHAAPPFAATKRTIATTSLYDPSLLECFHDHHDHDSD